ncbi:MAG: hypothetical protein ABEH81_10780 [Halopenitus sp.]
MTDDEATGAGRDQGDADDAGAAEATTDGEAAARTRPLPDPWTEVVDHDYIVEKYDPRDPVLFERADRERAVHILPTEPNVAHADTHEWRIGLVRGDVNELLDTESIARVHGRENAYHVAVEFMGAYEEAVPEEGDDVNAIAYATEQAEMEADAIES